MEQQFNINNVIEHYRLDTEEVAKVLFPAIKYPKLAFDRIIKGEAYLDTEQLEKLAEYIGVLVPDLFSAGTWKGSSEDGCLILLKGNYKVKLNYKAVYLSIYKDNTLIYQKFSNVPEKTLIEFINFLDNFIKDYENGSI